MVNTYRFIAYLGVHNKMVGMRIQILGDINGHSVFDMSRKLLDKYGITYNMTDKESDWIDLEYSDDNIPELKEDMVGFNRWLLFSSEKFGISEYFTCNYIRDCSMCPLLQKTGYCTGDYGAGLCRIVLGLKNVGIRNLVGYLNAHKSLLQGKDNYIKSSIVNIEDIIESEYYSSINIGEDGSLTSSMLVLEEHKQEVEDNHCVEKDENKSKPEKELKQENKQKRGKRPKQEIKQKQESKPKPEKKPKVVSAKKSVKTVKTPKAHIDTSARIKQLKTEINELSSKYLMVSALNKRISLYDSDFEDKNEIKLKLKLESKQNELIQLMKGERVND